MKNITKIFAIALVALGFSATSFAQSTNSASVTNATAAATIVAPITITNPTALNFGTSGTLATASTVILAADGSRSGTAPTFAGSAAPSAGVFAITGSPSATFAITMPSSGTVLTGPSSATMTITDWVSSLGTASVMSVAGDKSLVVTGTLLVGANQLAGVYNGTYAVTVAYN